MKISIKAILITEENSSFQIPIKSKLELICSKILNEKIDENFDINFNYSFNEEALKSFQKSNNMSIIKNVINDDCSLRDFFFNLHDVGFDLFAKNSVK